MPRFWLACLCALALLTCGATPTAPQTPTRYPFPIPVQVLSWLTTEDRSQLIAQQPAFPASGAPFLPLRISISTTPAQKIIGFGGALTDTSSFLIAGSPASASLMQALFSPTQGIGISLLRQPMGCSDFCSVPFYSYDDAGTAPCPQLTDSTLACFSLGHDSVDTLPLLQQARTLNPKLTLMASPWSAPAWMKTSNSLLANSNGSLIASDYGVYASYFVKFLQGYAASGIPISYLTAQNEPGACVGCSGQSGGYPGMDMSASEEQTFIDSHLAPALASAGLSPGILMYDWNVGSSYPESSFISTFQGDSHIAGTSIHCYGGMPTSSEVIAPWLLTECAASISPYASTPGNPLAPIDAILQASNAGAEGAVFWNLAEDQQNGPRPQGASGCACTPLVLVQTSNGVPTGQITYTNDYYALGMVSTFVAPGASALPTSVNGSAVEAAAFVNANGQDVLVVHNETQQAQSFDVLLSGKSFACQAQASGCQPVPPGAIETFVW